MLKNDLTLLGYQNETCESIVIPFCGNCTGWDGHVGCGSKSSWSFKQCFNDSRDIRLVGSELDQ